MDSVADGTTGPLAQAQTPAAPLTPTGRVILGMLALGKRTGYDIKQLVDKSTRHFWAASYGQIYPELKRLEEQGLITGRAEPTGGRARMVYALTPAGKAALERWLSSADEPLEELRDEGMLKLFFSDATTPEVRIRNLEAMRARDEEKLAQLRALQAYVAEMKPGQAMTLELGIAITERSIEWLQKAQSRLSD
jgi:PadR family transcriptional regulator, regulatory protein AphA